MCAVDRSTSRRDFHRSTVEFDENHHSSDTFTLEVLPFRCAALFVQFTPDAAGTAYRFSVLANSCGSPTPNFRNEADLQHGISNLTKRRCPMVTKSKNPMVATTAGAIAGGIETLTIWPMEMIKTNLQLGTMRAQYTGMIGGFRYHVQTDGVGSLYRGLAPVLVGSIPKAGIRFGAFDFIKQRLADENGKTSAMRNLAAGMMAGAIEATLTTTPIETLKTKLIGANAGVWEGTKMILAKEGIRGIYQGLWATILKQSTNQGLRFMWFSEFQKQVNPEFLERHGIISDAQNMTGSQRASLSLIGGMTAGIFSVFGNNPFDVVKTRMQGLEAQRYKSTFDCFRQMLLHEGVGSFYAGVVPRLGRVIPGQGVIFMSYDSITMAVSRYIEG